MTDSIRVIFALLRGMDLMELEQFFSAFRNPDGTYSVDFDHLVRAIRSTGAQRVFLTHCGDKKIQTIKIIRQYFGHGLKDAKEMTDACTPTHSDYQGGTPVYLGTLETEQIQSFKLSLLENAAGSTIELLPILGEHYVEPVGSAAPALV